MLAGVIISPGDDDDDVTVVAAVVVVVLAAVVLVGVKKVLQTILLSPQKTMDCFILVTSSTNTVTSFSCASNLTWIFWRSVKTRNREFSLELSSISTMLLILFYSLLCSSSFYESNHYYIRIFVAIPAVPNGRIPVVLKL